MQSSNLGICFVSFRFKENAADAIEDLDLIQEKFSGNPNSDKIGLQNWQIERSCRPDDILWTNLESTTSTKFTNIFLVRVFLALIPIVVSFCMVTGVIVSIAIN